MKYTMWKKGLVLFFLAVLLLFRNAPALSEQLTVNDKIRSMVEARFPVTELDIGELAVAQGNGMTFRTRVFDAAGAGRLCLMEMDSAFGKMYTATFTPIELDAPIFSCDYMLFGEEQTLLLELYDAAIASPDDTGFSFDALAECKEGYAALPKYERDAAWSDELLLPASDFKKGTGMQAELDGYLLYYSETYFDLMRECERCDPASKLAANAVLGRGLIEKGGLAVNSFKGMIGEEATEKLICDYMFRCR